MNKHFCLLTTLLTSMLFVPDIQAQDDIPLFRDEIIQVTGAQSHPTLEGVGYIEFGEWESSGSNVTLSLERPKGAEAGYPVSIMYRYLEYPDSYSLSLSEKST